MDAGSRLLVHALRTQRVPSLEDMFVSLRQPMLRFDSNIPHAPVTPGYRCEIALVLCGCAGV